MFEQLIWYLKGYVRIRVTGYSPERFLNACRYKNIYIWDLKRVCGSYEMNLTIDGFRRNICMAIQLPLFKVRDMPVCKNTPVNSVVPPH